MNPNIIIIKNYLINNLQSYIIIATTPVNLIYLSLNSFNSFFLKFSIEIN